jgi:hypothetical protein
MMDFFLSRTASFPRFSAMTKVRGELLEMSQSYFVVVFGDAARCSPPQRGPVAILSACQERGFSAFTTDQSKINR